MNTAARESKKRLIFLSLLPPLFALGIYLATKDDFYVLFFVAAVTAAYYGRNFILNRSWYKERSIIHSNGKFKYFPFIQLGLFLGLCFASIVAGYLVVAIFNFIL